MPKTPKKVLVQNSGSPEKIEACVKKGHAVKVSYYGEQSDPLSIAIDCEDCWEVLLEWEKA